MFLFFVYLGIIDGIVGIIDGIVGSWELGFWFERLFGIYSLGRKRKVKLWIGVEVVSLVFSEC